MRKVNVLAVILLVLCIVSCKKSVHQDSAASTTEETGYVSADQLKLDFAKALAKAMAEPAVRNMLKEESLKKIDNDYDVLFHLVKEKEVKPGVTFLDYLNSMASAKDAFTKFSEEAPLLTILVPSLFAFSAENWNTTTEIPVVAVVNNDFIEKKQNSLIAFDQTGDQLSLPALKEPNRPVVVVKENERIIGVPASTSNARAVRHNLVFANSNAGFFFTDDSFNGALTGQLKSASMFVNKSRMEAKVKEAFSLNASSQRDYVYYDILNPNDIGALHNEYAEYLTYFTVNSQSAMSYLYEDPTSDWSDGALEFQIDVLFFNGKSALNKVSKVVNIPKTDLITNDGTSKVYAFPTPIMITTWDMEKMGDTWKYVVNEIDPATVTTNTHNLTSKFSANFKFDIGFGSVVKFGIGGGGSVEETTSNTTTIQVTTGSDFCGESIVNFTHPIITSDPVPLPLLIVNDNNTGTVGLVVHPAKIQ